MKKNYLLATVATLIITFGSFLFWHNSTQLKSISQKNKRQKQLQISKNTITSKQHHSKINSTNENELEVNESPQKRVFQVILGKEYYDKVSASEALQFFYKKHPYNNHEFKTIEEWQTIPKYDRPDLAMEQEILMTLDPALGYVPHERRIKAFQQTQEKLANKAAISGVNWTERGPNNIGGRTRALMFDPNDVNDQKVWAGGVAGGLWFNNDITDANSSWQKVDDFWDNMAVTCIAYDPSNTDVFYVGTGEGFFNADEESGKQKMEELLGVFLH